MKMVTAMIFLGVNTVMNALTMVHMVFNKGVSKPMVGQERGTSLHDNF